MKFGRSKALIALVVVVLVGGSFAVHHAYRERRLREQLELGQAALDRRDFRQAREEFNSYLEQRPNDLQARLLAAQAARRQKDFEEARRHLRVHREQKGPEPERRREQQLLAIQLGDILAGDRLLEDCLRHPSRDDAALILEVTIEQKLKMLEEAFNNGVTLLEGPAGRERDLTEQALDLWSKLRIVRADQVQGHLWRGKLNLLLNQRAAVNSFRTALELDPTHFDARLNLALSLVDFDTREAAWQLEVLRERDPKHVQVSVFLAYFRRSLGQLKEAKQLLDEVLAVDSNHLTALLERAKATMDAGDPREAEPYFRRALARAPHEAFIHLSLSRCLMLTGNTQEAKQHEQRYNEMETTRTQAQFTRAESERQWRKRMMKELRNEGKSSSEP